MSTKAAEKPQRLLVVDDDAIVLESMAIGLTRAGYEVVAAESGEAALEHARCNAFDLALADMRMPGMSGAQLARALLAEQQCFSLILSGHDEPGLIHEAIEDGALGYLIKPFELARMLPTIQVAVLRARELKSLIRSHDHLATALKEGRETSMAVGVLMERLRLDRQSAFEKLRELARSRRRKIAEVSGTILDAVEALALPPSGPR